MRPPDQSPIEDLPGRLLGANPHFAADRGKRERAPAGRAFLSLFPAEHADTVAEHFGHLLEVHCRACRSLGYRREEILAMRVMDLDPALHMATQRALWRSARPGQLLTVEGHLRRRDGSDSPVEVRLCLLQGSPDRLHLAILRDLGVPGAARVVDIFCFPHQRQHLAAASIFVAVRQNCPEPGRMAQIDAVRQRLRSRSLGVMLHASEGQGFDHHRRGRGYRARDGPQVRA